MPNRLSLPYLQSHNETLLDWYPWCDEAFEKARNERKAIFISIGYSNCRLCHLMEEEVFNNGEIAQFLNEHLVCIKVDRDERPDLGRFFQGLHLLLNRKNGGWPLSIFCTPDNKPFYAATYIPPYSRDQQMGFSELATIIVQKVSDNDEKLLQNADEITTFMHPKNDTVEATRLDERIIDLFVNQVKHNFDPLHGGFSKIPKFPHTSTLKTLLTIERFQSEESRAHIIVHTLNNMARGGMYDLIEGGFFRYSIDQAWLVPHFEKTIYDNALLIELYALAGFHLNNLNFTRIAKECADFMIEKMMENNLFYSASYLDTEKDEEKYPFIDRKINTAWNAMMIKSLLAIHEELYTTHALISLDTLLSSMIKDGQLYHTTLIHKTPKIKALLEDYAYLADTLISAYQYTFNEFYLVQAQGLANKALELFYDNGIWYFCRGEYQTICELDDSSYPSAMAIIIDVLLSLGTLIDPKYRLFAFKSLEYVSLKLMKTPIYYPRLTEQCIRYLKGDLP